MARSRRAAKFKASKKARHPAGRTKHAGTPLEKSRSWSTTRSLRELKQRFNLTTITADLPRAAQDAERAPPTYPTVPVAIDRTMPAREVVVGATSRPTPPRTILQCSAVRNRRLHAGRAFARVAVLVSVDILCFVGVLSLLELMQAAMGTLGIDFALQLAGWTEMGGVEIVVALCAGLFIAGAYNGGDFRRDANRLAAGVGLGILMAAWGPLWRDFVNVVPALVSGATAFIIAAVLVRWSVDKLLKRIVPVDPTPSSTLLVGTAEETLSARRTSPFNRTLAHRPVVCLDPSRPTGDDQCYGMGDLASVIATHDVDTIVLCGQLDDRCLAHLVISADAAGCRVVSPSRAFSLASLTPLVHWQSGVPMIELTRPGLHGRDLMLKRVLDLSVSGLALIAAAPIMLVVALLVRLTSPGPIVFRQTRIGYSGRSFTILKFRTMFTDAEERLAALRAESVYGDGKLFKMAHDPRITPLGRWLRKSSLDELPQLFNVLRGEMSLVGPRPPLPREVELYEDEEFIRFGMKPGVTGPWQVSGRNRITSFTDVLRIESAYFTGWTIWRDFRILARTVPAVLRMDGAQ